jgi:hypothetical protein
MTNAWQRSRNQVLRCGHHRLRFIIPASVELILYRWRQRSGGDVLHPRYILTERGGLSFEFWLDEGELGETLDISLK